ncbi:MAG TPA: S8 family serine peptidase, partial [Stenomitos sp.]
SQGLMELPPPSPAAQGLKELSPPSPPALGLIELATHLSPAWGINAPPSRGGRGGRTSLPTLLLALSLAGCQLTGPLPVAEPTGSFAAGQLLVQFKPQTTDDAVESINRAVGATTLDRLGTEGLWLVSVPPGHEREVMDRYRGQGQVAYSEVNRSVSTQMVGGFRPYVARQIQADPPKDPLYYPEPLGPDNTPRRGLPGQWGLDAMKVRDAWNTTLGTAAIKVAVLDTGVDMGHDDLKANLDTANAYNFVDAKTPTNPDDDYGHGTHVAGIIAATANNGLGIAGVAPGCKVMPIRVLGVEGGSTANLIRGIDWAVSHGARVLNMSLGSNQYSRAEEDAIKRAIAQGVVVVAAAGNEALSGNPLSYPGAIEGVVSVAALRRDVDATGTATGTYSRADYSNFNPFVTVAAPGSDILSTIPRRFQSPGGVASDAPYAYASGTSMASPMVAGVVALMLSKNDKLTPQQVLAKLRSSADVSTLRDSLGNAVTARPNLIFGSGLVQAAGAL